MPGWEIINYKGKKGSYRFNKKRWWSFIRSWFRSKKKKYHTREFEKLIAKNLSLVSHWLFLVVRSYQIALKSLEVKQGDEVITQAFNFIATVEAILDTGAKPIIVDIDNTLNMCPKDLKRKFQNALKL